MKQVDRIKNFVEAHNNSMYSLNTEGAKYYGATFDSKTKWYGSFEWDKDDVKKYDYQVDLSTGNITKKGKVVGSVRTNSIAKNLRSALLQEKRSRL